MEAMLRTLTVNIRSLWGAAGVDTPLPVLWEADRYCGRLTGTKIASQMYMGAITSISLLVPVLVLWPLPTSDVGDHHAVMFFGSRTESARTPSNETTLEFRNRIVIGHYRGKYSKWGRLCGRRSDG